MTSRRAVSVGSLGGPFSRLSWPWLLLGFVLALPLAVLPGAGQARAANLPSNCTQSGDTVTCTFGYTGSEQTFTVPAGISSVQISAVGASGNVGTLIDNHGGAGGTADSTVTVSAPETLYVEVGGPGQPAGASTGGFNGGGHGGIDGGGGGGASDVRSCSSTTTGNSCPGGVSSLATRLVVAGGGGGGGIGATCCGASSGGAGGAPGSDGGPGQPDRSGAGGGAGGTAATLTTPGRLGTGGTAGPGGSSGSDGQGGSLGLGGNGGRFGGGGGGGGGYYGGGGGGGGGNDSHFNEGGGGGGGGGSSFGPTGSVFARATTGPQVVISYTSTPTHTPTPTPTPTATPSAVAVAQTGGFDFRLPLIGLTVIVAGLALYLVSAGRPSTGR